MKKIIFSVLLILFSQLIMSQNAIVGSGFSSGWGNACSNNNDYSYFSNVVGDIYGAILNPNNNGNQYWRFGIDWGGTIDQRTNTIGSDIQVNPGTKYSLNSTCTGNGALYHNVGNTSHNYVFRTLNAGNNPTGDWVFFIVEGTIRTVSSVSTPSPLPVINQPTEITATISGSLSTGQAVFLRYSNDNFATSSVIKMDVSGTSAKAVIPGQSANTVVRYYVFTSGDVSSISGGDADLFTINLNNNSGSNYSYTVQNALGNRANGVEGCDGKWSTNACWFNNAVPNSSSAIVNIVDTIMLDQNATVLNIVIQNNAALISDSTTPQTLFIASDGAFTAATGKYIANNGRVEFTGRGTITGNISFYDLDLKPSFDRTIHLTSNVTELTINGKLHIYDRATLNFNGNNMVLIGDIQREQPIGALTNMGLVSFSGSSDQTQTGNITYLGGLTINKSGGALILNTNGSNTGIDIPNGQTLTLTNGIIDAETNSSYVIILQGGNISSGNNDSHIEGELRRVTNNTSEYNFPVGYDSVLRLVGMLPQGSSVTTYSVKAGGAASNSSDLDSGVNNVSSLESWEINRLNGTEAAKIKLYWTSSASAINDVSDIFVAHFVSGQWIKEASTGSGNSNSGNVETDNYISSFSPFTFGSGSSGLTYFLRGVIDLSK